MNDLFLNYMNSSDEGYVLFYSIKKNQIEVYDLYCDEDQELTDNSFDLIKMPFSVYDRRWLWRIFYDMLSDEELKLVKKHDGSCSFFEYLRETGLISIYYDAQDKILHLIYAQWEYDNGVTIDWSTVDLPY